VPDHAGLLDFVQAHQNLFVLTGAGCSTDSGIPDYRSADGEWKRAQPVTYQAFVADGTTRQRYWARSLIGWQRFGGALPNRAHRALASLEHLGRVRALVTQNVDGLHQRAGHGRVIDLHGRLDQVICLQCRAVSARQALQQRLIERNPGWAERPALQAPDGDADLEATDFSQFVVPGCDLCGGMLKPDVVFYGENVPPQRVTEAYAALASSDAVLVVGSSLMVYSGYRFAVAAAEAGQPIAAINLGRTRADDLLQFKIAKSCGDTLERLVADLSATTPAPVPS